MDVSKVLAIVSFGLVLSACQKSTLNAVDGITGQDSSQSLSACANKAQKVSLDSLKIEGAPTAQAGDALTYSLNEDTNCVQNQKVIWKTAASPETQEGGQMTSTFAKAGSYVVSAQIENEVGMTKLSYKTLVVNAQAAISGPQFAMVGYAASFALAVPATMSLANASWNFGDGSAAVTSLNSVSHVFPYQGNFNVTVSASDADGNPVNLNHAVTVLPIQDGLQCVTDLAISSPAEGDTGAPISMSVFIPSCLTGTVTSVQWNFGDSSVPASNQNVQHTFTTPGTYPVSVDLFVGGTSEVYATLTTTITIADPIVTPPTTDPTPAPSATPVATPSPSPSPSPTATPSPTPTPTPTPNPMACSRAGLTRDSQGDLYSEDQACGNGGKRTVSFRDRTRESCDMVGDQIIWHLVSTTKEVQSTGACQGEFCILDDGSHLNSGEKRRVVSGETKVPLTCGFGEQGFFSTFTELTDKSCKDGIITSSNTHQGDIKVQGQCPTYNFVATDTWSACSADCGGTQTRVNECRNSAGVAVGPEFCAGKVAPVETRACDGNPAAVVRNDAVVTQEDGGSSAKCAANEIGVIITERDVSTTSSYACVDHKVQLAKTTVAYGAWVSESHCKTYVAYRCSQDSLSNSQAQGRYDWMAKCENQVPVIKTFLDEFEVIKVQKGSVTLSLDPSNPNAQHLYPTFMLANGKPWIAPTVATAACQVPSTAYVAAVCVSSCATPEQQILAEVKQQRQLKYTSFIDALTRNLPRVATLASVNSMNSKAIVHTSVQQWVTELMDTNHVIIDFKMKSGRELKLTPNHPVVATDGTMKLAGDFKVGDSLVQLGGEADEILSADRIDYFGKVYNLFVNSSDINRNIVITNGYLNGTAYFQNQGTKDMNRGLFKKTLTTGVFSK